jgi:DNA-binding MarR family transcriptional regulator
MRSNVNDSEVSRFLDAWFGARQLIQAANFNRFHQAGLSATQFMALNVLPAAPRTLPIGELARHLNLKPATVAQTVNSLEERGLVTRHRGETDRRQVLLRVTTKGARLQNSAAGRFKRQMAVIFGAMEPDKRLQLIAGLEQFVQVGRSQETEAIRKAGGEPRAERSD